MIKVHVIVKYVIHSSGEDNDFKIMYVFFSRNCANVVCKKLKSLNTDRDTTFCIESYRVI